MISRRRFIQSSSVAAAASILPLDVLSAETFGERKFTLCLNAGNIGVKASQHELFNMAVKHGFEAISVHASELAEMSHGEVKAFLKDMEYKNVSWGSAGLPVDFRKDESTFREGLKPLPDYIRAMERAGANRMNTWILSFDHSLTYLQNFKQHVLRLREVATILNDHGVRLGLEYVGPRTLQAVGQFSFIRTMAETRELIAEIDRPNVGFVLDSFHWYCAGETKEDLLTLSNEEIVAVDLNDARSGVPADEQIDGKRELPSATGVIDLKAFLTALISIGYDGPIRAEPFNQPLRDMEDDEALSATYQAMKKSFDLV
jgi:sugar phosphate isomerase/epimerase